MTFLSKITFLSVFLGCSVVVSSLAGAQSGVSVINVNPYPYLSLTTASTVTSTVETRTAKYHVFSEPIKMTATVGELWQANGDVLYQTNNHDVTDLVKNDDGTYAVKFTNPGEAMIRVYIRKNGKINILSDFGKTLF